VTSVLVTGGAGFIGGPVVRALVGAGHRVSVLDLAEPADGPGGVHVVTGDVRDADVCRRAVGEVSVVVHHAATVGMGVDLGDLPRYAGVNAFGTAVLLAAMHEAGVGRLVLASSMVVYGEGAYLCAEHGTVTPADRVPRDLAAGRFEPPCPQCGRALTPGLVTEDARLEPRSVYAASKVAQEHLAGAWCRAGGGRAVLLRYHNVYGPGMPRDTPYAGVAALFRSALLAGRAPQVTEDGAQRRDFVHVEDVASANVAAVASLLHDGPPGGPVRAYNVASGEQRTVLDLARTLSTALDGPQPQVTGTVRAGDVRHVTADAGRLRRELGWRPRVTFSDGMTALARETPAA
jgi:dTDP-L-rhamnose 4-epimerase